MGSRVPVTQLDAAVGARFAVFEYMISNYDWSMRAGPEGDDCCHNGRLPDRGRRQRRSCRSLTISIIRASSMHLTPPPEGIPVDNVRQRTYRGYCATWRRRAVVAQLNWPRAAQSLPGVYDNPRPDPRNQARAANFIQGFFSDLDSGKIFKNCIGS